MPHSIDTPLTLDFERRYTQFHRLESPLEPAVLDEEAGDWLNDLIALAGCRSIRATHGRTALISPNLFAPGSPQTGTSGSAQLVLPDPPQR